MGPGTYLGESPMPPHGSGSSLYETKCAGRGSAVSSAVWSPFCPGHIHLKKKALSPLRLCKSVVSETFLLGQFCSQGQLSPEKPWGLSWILLFLPRTHLPIVLEYFFMFQTKFLG